MCALALVVLGDKNLVTEEIGFIGAPVNGHYGVCHVYTDLYVRKQHSDDDFINALLFSKFVH